MVEKSLNVKGKQLLMEKNAFISLLLLKFELSETEAELFWDIAYNDHRFQMKECLSMKAFAYNFGKFYT